jgi:hypothetical protein
MKGTSHTGGDLRAALSIVLSVMLALSLTACKPTDFFTEVVITPFSDVVDYNNPETTVVNSPDAQKESAILTALDWTDDSPRSESVENLVTYSDEPTSTLTAHHSLFNLKPRFPGIMASDPVRLVFDNESPLEHEAEADEQDIPALEAVAQSAGGAESQDDSEPTSSDEAATGETDGTGEEGGESGGDEAGDDPDGSASNPENQGEGTGEGDGEGTGENPYGGYNGEVNTYNPGDAFSRVNRVDHLAVLGNDVAVMAQSLGGVDTICAMNEYAYYGLDASGVRATTYAIFADVFADEDPSLEGKLLWSGSGSSPASVKDIDALVAACGQKGIIVYDQRMGNANDLFDLEQRRRLQAAAIQLVPVDMSTVQGMLDAAQVIGDALSERDNSRFVVDARAMSRDYIRTVNDIVRSVAATNGGYLAARNAAGGSLLTSYNSPPVTSYRFTHTFGYIATDSESGLTYSGSEYVDVSRIVLFGNYGSRNNTPLSFWMQAAGVWDNTGSANTNNAGLELLRPLNITGGLLGGGRSGGAWSRWLGTHNTPGSPPPENWVASEAFEGAGTNSGLGLGSYQVPYLIVAASDGRSAGQVKDAVVESMLANGDVGKLTPYSVLRYGSDHAVPTAYMGDGSRANAFSSSLGGTQGMTAQSPFYSTPPLAVDAVIRENPIGLLGSWTEGSMESVLEAVWLADIYSRSPQGCGYDPITSMSNFSVSIGGTTCTTTRDTVLQFYQTFYRCDASGVFGSIVTDEGV